MNLDDVRKQCQYSKLWQVFGDMTDQDYLRRMLSEAIKKTGYSWHMKPAAVYLHRDTHVALSWIMCERIPIRILDGVPRGAFLLTDGQEE